jgi:hypothetical protein
MKSIKFLVGVLGFSAALSLTSAASAEYICTINYRSFSSNSGNNGYAAITFYTQADCGGALASTKYVCTAGATNTSCPTTTYLRTEPQLLAELPLLHSSMISNGRITFSTTGCMGGGAATCLAGIFYNAN